MSLLDWNPQPLSVLVSVRSVEEAAAAMTGGAAVIDVKEPARGPLGRADAAVVREVAGRVAGRRPVTAAAGDLGEFGPAELAAWASDSTARLVKVGVAAPPEPDVLAQLATVRRALPPGVSLAPALYADRFDSPPSLAQLSGLRGVCGGKWMVIDTADKSGPSLTTVWSRDQLSQLILDAAQAGLKLVVAGSLSASDIEDLSALKPAVLGVRGAVCQGGRAGTVCQQLVARVVAATSTARVSNTPRRSPTPRTTAEKT